MESKYENNKLEQKREKKIVMQLEGSKAFGWLIFCCKLTFPIINMICKKYHEYKLTSMYSFVNVK